MDHPTLKKHLLSQILHHPDGISQDQLVAKTAEAAGVSSEEHRDKILEWVHFLVTTGHIRHHEKTITAEQASRLEFQGRLEDLMDHPTRDPRLSEWLLH